jgi:hypothetical protein
MTNRRNPRVPDPGLEPISGEQQIAMRSETNYRDLERGYRQTEQYAWMQKRYPQLRFWITHCHPTDLVGGDSKHAEPGSTLQWERSHGEN